MVISKFRVCSEPGCGEIVAQGGRCPSCKRAAWRAADRFRPSAADRGYGAAWRRGRAAFLQANPICVDCGGLATVPDHDPVSRVELVRHGDPNPDAWQHLRPRCKPCHDRRTVREDGAFGR